MRRISRIRGLKGRDLAEAVLADEQGSVTGSPEDCNKVVELLAGTRPAREIVERLAGEYMLLADDHDAPAIIDLDWTVIQYADDKPVATCAENEIEGWLRLALILAANLKTWRTIVRASARKREE